MITEKNTEMDCLQRCFLKSCEDMRLAQAPLLACWGFSFQEGQSCLAACLQKGNGKLRNDFYRKYFNMEVQFYEHTFPEDYPFMEAALKAGDHVIIGIDAYGCRWNLAFGKAHVLHFLIASALNEKGQLVCLDPYLSHEKYTVSFTTLKKIYKNMRIIKNAKQKETKILPEKELANILCSDYEAMVPSGRIADEYHRFAENVTKAIDFSWIFEREDVRLCRVILDIGVYTEVRSAIAEALMDYGDRWTVQSVQFQQLAKDWATLKVLFMKLFLKRTLDDGIKQSLAKHICSIAEQEETLFYNISKRRN